jgi:hypothetical protein
VRAHFAIILEDFDHFFKYFNAEVVAEPFVLVFMHALFNDKFSCFKIWSVFQGKQAEANTVLVEVGLIELALNVVDPEGL